MKTLQLLCIITFCGIGVQAQKEYQGLMDSVIITGQVILNKPLNFLGLTREDYEHYSYNLMTDYGIMMDTAVIGQIIDNSARMDTHHWRPYHMWRVAFVKKRNTNISKRCTTRHLSYLSPTEGSIFKEAVIIYNSQPRNNRSVSEFSRPVFSNDKQFAAIRYNSIYHFGVDLYYFNNGSWHLVGSLIVGGY